jgi:hypothetical protein
MRAPGDTLFALGAIVLVLFVWRVRAAAPAQGNGD